MEGGERDGPIFRDIRRYYCEYCGICRSKKALIKSHILCHHQDKIKEKGSEDDGQMEGMRSYACEECGVSFRKPAYLKQHIQSHSLERPFKCTIDDCNSSYRRKDHLTRHLLQHQGKLFACPVVNCNFTFALQCNMKRHVKQFHEDTRSVEPKGQKEYVCQEVDCGKVFKYASKLRKHEESHVTLDSAVAVCSEPSCLKIFSNAKCLKAHLESCHQHVICEICGTKQLKKNFKRHLRMHSGGSVERIKCEFEDCLLTFSTKSNLCQHMKAAHLELRPFACRMPDCGLRFSFKHVRDKHEKTGCHVHNDGDFLESDELFASRPRGGRKRKCPPIESLTRKRITPLCQLDDVLSNASEFLAWQLS